MPTFEQLQEMDRAWHDAANAFQRLGCAMTVVDVTAAYADFQRAQERYAAAKEGKMGDAGEQKMEAP